MRAKTLTFYWMKNNRKLEKKEVIKDEYDQGIERHEEKR